MNSSEWVGSVFIRSGTQLPKGLHASFEDWGGWNKLLHVTSYALELMALREGWHFSFIITAVNGGAFGLTRYSAMRNTMKKVMETMNMFSFNSLEITEVASDSTLALHHVDIVANPRHLWPNPFLQDLDPHYYSNSLRNFKPILWKGAEINPEIEGI